ncbi:MAG TPA: glutathione S-transferase [Rhizomicrobium sp.]|nr:glutathione S-transferase [Rhizomicrobium sp.]
MKLYGSPISPFARKAMVIAHELGMKLEVLPRPENAEEFRRINPLGKIPALVMNDGSAIFDSPVICEYLNDRGGGKFFPGNSLLRGDQGKWRALTLQALGDGLADAAVAVMGERRSETPNQARIAHHMTAVNAALDALERIKLLDPPTIGEIAAACALGYVEFRLTDLDWRPSRPKLSAWYDKFCDYPSMKATAPQ